MISDSNELRLLYESIIVIIDCRIHVLRLLVIDPDI